METAVIKKLNLNSSGVESVEMIHDTRGFSIVGLDYHHRLVNAASGGYNYYTVGNSISMLVVYHYK